MCLGKPANKVVPINDLNSTELQINEITSNCEYRIADDVSSSGNLSVLHLNIRSLNKNHGNLKELLSAMMKNNVDVDFILLCETWLNDDNMSLIDIEGYNCLSINRNMSSGGGIAIYIKKCYKPEIVQELSVIVSGQYESLFVEIPVGKRKLLLGEMYRIPNSNEKVFQDHLDKIMSACKGRSCLIGSDQNLDLLKHTNHKPTGKFLDTILENGLVPLIHKPTRVTHKSYTLIDNLYISVDLMPESSSTVLVEHFSDHFPCLGQLHWPFKRSKEVKIVYTRKLNDKKIQTINNDLLFQNWLDMLDPDNDINDNYISMITTITDSVEKIAPLKRKVINSRNVLKLPWMNVSLLKCSKKCKHLYQKSLTKSKDSLEWARFVKYRNSLNRLKAIARKDYINKVIDSYKGDTKQIWHVINDLAGRNNDKTSIINELVVDGKKVTGDNAICEALNTHFSSAGKKTTANCSKEENLHKQYLRKRVSDCLLLSPCSDLEITI